MKRMPGYQYSFHEPPPLPGEEFLSQWIYLAELLEKIAGDFSAEKQHTRAIEQYIRAKEILAEIALIDPKSLPYLFFVIISLIREYVILERLLDAHHLCIQAVSEWEPLLQTSHQKLIFAHIRYCKALIETELTLYEEAIYEYELIILTWKGFVSKDMGIFMPIIKKVAFTLNLLYHRAGHPEDGEKLQNYLENLCETVSEKKTYLPV